MKIINIVNSFIGKKGNIGLRTSYIISELNSQKIKNFSYSRGVVKYFEKNNKNMRIFGHIPRILNAFRIYINLWFNHRKYDIWFFEKFFFLSYKKSNCENKIAHVWETSPKIIKKLKNDGFKVVLDLPIAPTATAKGLIDIFGDKIILHPHEYNDKLERESFILADKIISPSIFVKYELEKIGVDTKKIIVIPFGTDVKNIESKIFSKNYEKDGIDFVFAGNINKRKGVDFLLEAWNDDVFRNDRLHLCGRLYPEVEQLIKKYNLKNIITPGFINTRKYFTKCDVYVFPSLLEGSSKSIYEAMSASLPCIVTPNSGSVIEDCKDGFIIDVANSNQIKDKMMFFKKNPNMIETMGKIAKENIYKYTWDNYSKNVIKLYREMNT